MLVVASVTESSQQVQDSKQWRLLFSLNLLWWSRRCIFIPRSLSLVTGESLSSPCLGERAARAQMLSRLGGGLPWCNLDRSTAQRPAAYVCLGEKQAGKLCSHRQQNVVAGPSGPSMASTPPVRQARPAIYQRGHPPLSAFSHASRRDHSSSQGAPQRDLTREMPSRCPLLMIGHGHPRPSTISSTAIINKRPSATSPRVREVMSALLSTIASCGSGLMFFPSAQPALEASNRGTTWER